jgi:hypothetical protein
MELARIRRFVAQHLVTHPEGLHRDQLVRTAQELHGIPAGEVDELTHHIDRWISEWGADGHVATEARFDRLTPQGRIELTRLYEQQNWQ